MSATAYFECFNNKMYEFLEDLSVCFPEIRDINLLKNGFQLARTIDMQMPRGVFNEHIAAKYESKILNKDEEFLMSNDYSDELKEHNVDMDVISRIKGIWGSLDDKDKDAIWKYLQVLVLLNKKCDGV